MAGATTVPNESAGPVGGTVPACRSSVPTEVEAIAVREDVAGLPAALLATSSFPLKVPAEAELNVTVIEQFAPMARVEPQVLPVTLKSL